MSSKPQDTLLYNSVPQQNLYSPSQLTIQVWNNSINILRTQANEITRYLKVLHQWLIGYDDPGVIDEIFSLIQHPTYIKSINDNTITYINNGVESTKALLTFDDVPTVDSSNIITSGAVYTALSNKQNTIDSSNKLSSDLVDDTNSIKKLVTASNITTWNTKQDALVFNTEYNAATNKVATMADVTGVYIIQGSASVSDLNSIDKDTLTVGFVYNIMGTSGNLLNSDNTTISVSEGDNVVYVGDGMWDKLAATVDLSNYQTLITSTNKVAASNISGLATVATSGNYSDLSNKPTIPTKVSDLYNDSHFTTVADLSNIYKIRGSISVSDLNVVDKSTINSGYVYNIIGAAGDLINSDSTTVTVADGDNVVFIGGENEWVWDKLAATVDLSGYQSLITPSNKLPASLVSSLSSVATSGSYNDLSNKPNVQTVSVSSTGTSTSEAKYITVGNTEYRLPGGMEIIEFPSDGTFTLEQINKIINFKACVKYDKHYYLPCFDLSASNYFYLYAYLANQNNLLKFNRIDINLSTGGASVLNDFYALQDSSINANPSGTANTQLTKIYIKGTKYSIPTYSDATTTTSGLMSSDDKKVVDNVKALMEGQSDRLVDSLSDVLEVLQNFEEETDIASILANKVDKISGKGLSTNDYTTDEKNKLAGISSGAEVNVQADWNVIDTSNDAYIKNKPTIPDAVSGTNDGTNWTSITIGSTTKAIPAGGGNIDAITTAEINAMFGYSITVSITNGTYSGDTFIYTGNTANVTLTASTGYALPSSIIVSGASYNYSNGSVTLSNPTGPVTITAVCPAQGYTVSVATFNDPSPIEYYYSTDNGTNWTQFNSVGALVTNATQIKFRIIDPVGMGMYELSSATLGLSMVNNVTGQAVRSDNYILTQNVTDIVIDEYVPTPPTPSLGYTLTLNHNVGLYFGGDDGSCKIKIGSAPSSENDYDYLATGSGGLGQLIKAGESLPETSDVVINNVSTVYIWSTASSSAGYDTDGSSEYTGANPGYANADVVTLSGDTTLHFQAEIED